MYAWLILLLLGSICSDLFITDLSQTFTSNLTHTAADQTEITRWMNLCASDARCSRFSGMSLGGDNAVQTFNSLLTLLPFTQLPPLVNNGIYDNLVGRNVSEANDRLMVLSMVYEFSYFASSCSATEIPVLLAGSITCQTNPRLSGVAPSNNTNVVIFLMCLLVLLLVIVVLMLAVMHYRMNSAIRKNTI